MKKQILIIVYLNIIILSYQILAQSVAKYDWINYGFFISRGFGLENVVLGIDSHGNLIKCNLINAGTMADVFHYYYIHKISSEGDLIWKIDNSTGDRHFGKILDLIIDKKDNIYVTGYNHVPFGADTLFVKKIITTLNPPRIDWEYIHLIGGDSLNIINRKFKLVQYDSSLIVTGITLNRKPLADIVTIKLDINGNEIWKRDFTNGENYNVSPKDLAVDNDGNVFVYGNSVKEDSSTTQLIKYNSSGNLLWNKTIANPNSPNISAVDIESIDGSVWISANSKRVTFLNKYDSNGNLIKEISRKTNRESIGIFIDKRENVYQICNDSILKYNSLGDMESSVGLPLSANYFDIDEDQNIYVLGKSRHFYMAKINQNLEVKAVLKTTWEDRPNAHYTSSTPFGIAASTEYGVFISGELTEYDSLNFNSSMGQVSIKYSKLPTDVKTNEIRPNSFNLFQNYPNPFNPSTVIKYQIPNGKSQNVNIKVYDVLGKEVATLVNKEQSAGSYEVEFNTSASSATANSLSSGIYFYKITVGSFSKTMKMVLCK